MASIVGLDDLSRALIDSGKSLAHPSSSTEELLTLLDETESLLRNVEQDPPFSMQCALIPSKSALVSNDLLSHPDSDVRVSVVSCLTEILRITAPEPPYDDDQMKEIFKLTIEAFEKLADSSSRSYGKAESVLDNVSKVRSCLVMLDLECYDLILQMFRSFLKIIRSDHPRVVFSSMEMIMITIIDETDEVSTDLLDILLASVKKENQNASPTSCSLVEKVLSRCACKLKPYIVKAFKSTGASLDLYSPVVSAVYHTASDTTEVHNTVNTQNNKAAETDLGRQVAPSDALEDKLGMGHSHEEIRSKSSSERRVRDGRIRVNVNDKVKNRNASSLLKQSLDQVRSESTVAETGIGITGKRGWKPNSLMNPEEGYDISYLLKTSSYKKPQKRGSGGESSLGKMSAKKTPLTKETSTATTRTLTGSVKRSWVKMDASESDHDSDSLASPRLKKLASCFRDAESLEKKSNQESYEKPDNDRKIGNSSKKTRSQNGVEKGQRAAKKKSVVEPKIVNTSGKRISARSDAKKRNLEVASPKTPVPQSSKGKKIVSQVSAKPLAEESEETSKSRLSRRRSARKEVGFDTNNFGEDLVGKRVKIWWPLDRRFYEGVVDSYISHKKKHWIVYTDGDSEALNLIKERWELIKDFTSASGQDEEIDLPESIPLFDIVQRQRVKKSKNVAVSVEPTSSSGVRSSSRTLAKKDSGKKLSKQVGRSKDLSNKGETREGKNLKSLKELNAETDRTEEQEVSQDVNHESEEYYDCSEEKQEHSDNKGEESLKLGDDTEEEEKHYATSEVDESEREENSDSEEEPKWRETEDMEDEAEEG